MLRPEMLQPATLEEAVLALSRRGAMPLAGATDLLPSLRKGEIRPKLFVNLKNIPGLAGIRRLRGGLSIGALTRVSDLLHDPLIAATYPILAEVAAHFASVQIRNLATIGGNLCNATPSADFALPLLALEAKLQIRNSSGARQLELADFFLGVNKTALKRGEILTAITLPRPRPRSGAAHAKLGVRQAMDLAFVGVVAALQLAPDKKKCLSARLALGAVAPRPMRALGAEALLEGNQLTNDVISQAAAAAAAESRPISDLRASAQYRREMVEVLTRRVLHEAFRRAKKE